MNTFDIKGIFDFIKLLEANNNREWFTENKELYLATKASFDKLVMHIGKEIEKFDPDFKYGSAKDYTFRIYRDVRFSKNKQPYKNHFGAYFSVGGRKSPLAGYYLHLQSGASFFGGGVYRPEKDKLKAIRQEIYYTFKDLNTILTDKTFSSFYSGLMDDKLKNGPKDFPKDSSAIDLLKYKSFAVAHNMSDDDIMKSDSIDKILHGFTVLKPLNDYLNNAIKLAE
jgi:uncharacterized protein (TIGR02453 family)